jgi:hypothetical protein
VDDEFVAVVEQQHHDLQEVARSIRAQPQLATRLNIDRGMNRASTNSLLIPEEVGLPTFLPN